MTTGYYKRRHSRQRPVYIDFSVQLLRRTLLLIGCALVASGARGAAQERPDPRRENQRQPQFEMADTARYRMFLQNRLVTFVVPDNRAPLVSFTAMVRGGTASDGHPGAAEMLALMLATRGPCWMAPGTFRETLQDMAAEFRVHMSPERTQISMNVAADKALNGLRVFSGIVREPCIDQRGLQTFRGEVARRDQNAGVRDSTTATFDGGITAAVNLFYDVLYGDHPYARRVREEDVRRLELKHVEDFHREVFVPANITVAVSGDFDLGQMAQAVDQRFADWEDRRPPFLRGAPGVDAPDTRLTHYFRADSDESWLVMGHELPEIDPRDLPALQVMNYILGGAPSDPRRSGQEDSGGTRYATGHLEVNMRGPGTYTFRATLRPEMVGQRIDLILRSIERMRTDAVSDDELRGAKADFTDRVFPMRFENGHGTALTLTEEWTNYGSFDPLAHYLDRIRNVSARDVQRAAQRYLDPERMQIVVLGPARPS